jgi:hypothetical protein
MDVISERIEEGRQILQRLLTSPKPFDNALSSKLPRKHGLYAISLITAEPGNYLRVGRTKKAADGLWQRVYQNHFMGDQAGNLRRQLLRDATCASLEETKPWIREHCIVQFAIVEDDQARVWAEYFVLSVLRPKYCD